jgi:hypothetical protein
MKHHRYTEKQLQFLKDTLPGRSLVETTKLFNRRFRLSVKTPVLIYALRKYKMYESKKSPRFPYTPEEIQFIKDTISGRTQVEMTELFNTRFGCQCTRIQIRTMLRKLGLLNNTWRTPEEIQFVKDTISGHTHRQMLKLFNERFPPITFQKLRSLISNQKLRSGTSKWVHEPGYISPLLGTLKYKPGHPKYTPIGTEILYKNSVTMVKVAEHTKPKPKQRLIWEAAHGPIPEGHVVIFADRNKSNFNLDNLLLVSREELGVMNKKHLFLPDAKSTKAGLLIAKIILRANDLLRKQKKERNMFLQGEGV